MNFPIIHVDARPNPIPRTFRYNVRHQTITIAGISTILLAVYSSVAIECYQTLLSCHVVARKT
jgi:hypothetical protein